MLINANALHIPIRDASVQCCVTSPPYYGLRDYGTVKWEGGDENCDHRSAKFKSRYDYSLASSPIQDASRTGTDAPRWMNICPACGAKKVDAQIGLEETPEKYIDNLVQVFREVWRVLKNDGTLWVVIGDSYWGGKGKSGYELPREAEERRGRGETFQRAHNVPGYMDMRPTDGKHPVIKPKDLIGIPWMLAFALRADGWYLRRDIIWLKRNPMPESVRDRPTCSHEYIFLLSKNEKYYYDYEAILEPADYDGRKDTFMKGSPKYSDGFMPGQSEQTVHSRGHERWPKKMPGIGPKHGENRDRGEKYESIRGYEKDGMPARNKRDVWDVPTKPYKGAHFAVYPPDLIEPCILAGSREGDIVLDPFVGSGTTCAVALKHRRKAAGLDLSIEYLRLAQKRIESVQPTLVA